MTHIYPCHSCPLREGCEQREEFKERARQANCTSIKFRCSILAGELRLGRRIVVAIPDDDGFGHRSGFLGVKATITRVVGYKFNCTVDPYQISEVDDSEEQTRFRRRRPHTNIVRFLDEPDTHVCAKGCVIRDELCDRGENFMEDLGEFDGIPTGLCACKRARWATHHTQSEAA